VLLGGIPGTMPAMSSWSAPGTPAPTRPNGGRDGGARNVLDLDTRKLEALDSGVSRQGGHAHVEPANIEHEVANADLLIGAVLIPAAKAPTVVTKKMVFADAPRQR